MLRRAASAVPLAPAAASGACRAGQARVSVFVAESVSVFVAARVSVFVATRVSVFVAADEPRSPSALILQELFSFSRRRSRKGSSSSSSSRRRNSSQ